MDGEQEPTQNQSDPAPSLPPGVAKPQGSPAQEVATAQQLEDVEKQMTGFEKATLRWAKAAVIMSALAAVFVCLQWWEMRQGGKDTHDLAAAATTQATQMTNLATAAGNQATWTERLAGHMGQQAADTSTIAGQAVVQANANTKLASNAVNTLANTKQSFRDEQRAWVGVQGTDKIKGFTETEPWQIEVVFFNSGRTPARNVQASGMYITSPIPIPGPSPQNVATLVFRPIQSIAPQGFYRENIGKTVGAEVSSADEVTGSQTLVSQYEQIKDRKLFLYYFGLLKYDDNSGRPHETQFCIYLSDPDTKQAGMCDSFNDLD